MDISTEVIIPPSVPKAKKRHGKRFILIFGIFLVLFSVASHLTVMGYFGVALAEDGKVTELLISAVFPKVVFAEKEPEEKTEEATSETQEEETEAPATMQTKPEISFYLKNETSYNPDLEVLYNSPNLIDKADELYERFFEDEPLVLIYHTHATESYSDTNDTGSYRSEDPSRNMIAVGEALCDALEKSGIKTLHLTEMFDAESYNEAYENSSAAVARAMEEYPSLQYIIDIHRDSITDSDGNYLGADFTFEENTLAQIMFVVGTDEGGSDHTGWRDNLTTVLHLQAKLLSASPDSVRAINLRKASFYQDKSPAAMLIEIGACGNTLEEAKGSAEFLASALSEYIIG